MEVIRIYPAVSNGGKSIHSRKTIVPALVTTYEEWPQDFDLTLVIANGESFIIDEDYNSFDKRLVNEKIIDPGNGGI